MRCKRHTTDLSSSIGVCASCLRERLISIAASTAASENEYSDNHHSHSQISPPPLVFPRSVSPYVAPRKSDAGIVVGDSKPRLFATPLVGPTHGGGKTSEKVLDSERSFKKKRNGLSRFSSFFRTRSADYDSSSTFLSPSSSSSSTSRSWLSKVLSVKSKKQTTCYIEDLIESESENHRNRPRQRFCKGMSPAGDSYNGESEQRRTPAMGTPVRKKTAMTTMGFCLSPLVRAKPNNSLNIWKGKFPPEFGYSGELKSPANPHISTAASFCGNRSKKLVDLGRVDPRR